MAWRPFHKQEHQRHMYSAYVIMILHKLERQNPVRITDSEHYGIQRVFILQFPQSFCVARVGSEKRFLCVCVCVCTFMLMKVRYFRFNREIDFKLVELLSEFRFVSVICQTCHAAHSRCRHHYVGEHHLTSFDSSRKTFQHTGKKLHAGPG